MTKREAAAVKLTAAYRQILEAIDDLGYPVKTDFNFAETAERALLKGASAVAVTALERAAQLSAMPARKGKWPTIAPWRRRAR